MDNKNRTYPHGYTIRKLGPPKLITAEEKQHLYIS
jgi:hypothetical protein